MISKVKNLVILTSVSGAITLTNVASQSANSFSPVKYAANNQMQANQGSVIYAQATTDCNQASWKEKILNCDGTINAQEYKNVANNYDQQWAIDYRFGPGWKHFYPNDSGNFPTVWGRTRELPAGIMLNADGSEHRQDFQWQEGWLTFSKKDPIKTGPALWFAYSGQLLYSPDAATDAGIARARSYADYHSGFTGAHTSAYDLKVSWTGDAANWFNKPTDPAVNQQTWIDASGGVKPRVPIAVDRARVMHSSIMGIVAFKNGLIGATSTGNAVDKYPFTKLATGRVPTALAVTPQNEFALVTVWDTTRQKGQVAVVAIKGRLNGGKEGVAHYWGLPYWPEAEKMKVLGYIDLPFAAPTAISVSTDVVKEHSGRAYPGDEDLNSQETRNKFANSVDSRHTLPKAGWAVVSSRAENKVAFIDLEPLFKYYRQMYFTSQENFDQTKNEGSAANQWPYLFGNTPQQKPVVAQVITVKQPTAVVAGYPFPVEQAAPGWQGSRDAFKGKAWITTMDGKLLIYDVGGLAHEGAATNVNLTKTVMIGKNPTHIDYGRGAEYSNVFITCRGDRAVYKLDISGNITAVLRDSRLKDPVSSHASQGIGPHILSVMDFSGKQAVNYMHKPLDPFGTLEGGGLGSDGKAQFEWTHSQPVPGMPFMFSTAEVI